jgi:DNA-binding transcriptional LysR family regulator
MAMDQLRVMRIFVRVIDEGSFAGAARVLDMAAPAVTRAIAELEDHLGSRLINRTTRSLSLTEVGAAYLERVRPIIDDVDDADSQASTATTDVRGRVRVTGSPALLGASLPQVLPEFQRRHENIILQLNGSLPLMEPDENADVTLLIQGPQLAGGNFVARLLAHTEVVLCATPAYLETHGRPQTPHDLTRHQVLIPDVPLVKPVWQFESVRPGQEGPGETVLIAPQPARVVSGSPELLVSAARHGMGIAGALSLEVAGDFHAGTLERVLPDWHIATFQVYAGLPMRTRVFVDFLVEKFGGRPVDPWLQRSF